MNIEAKKDGIKFDEVIIGCGSEVLAEADIILPGEHPDIAEILQLDATAHIKEKEVGGDKVILRGEVLITVIYTPDPQMSNSPAKSIITTASFTDVCQAQGVMPEMKIHSIADVSSIDYSLINSRKIGVKATVHTEIKASKSGMAEFICGAEGDTPVETLTSDIKAFCGQLDEDYEIIVSDRLDFPAGKNAADILKISPTVTEYNAKLLSDKCVLKGICSVSTLYVSQSDMQIQFMEHEIPFTEVLDAPGAAEDMDADIDFNIFSTYYETDEDENGICAIGVEIKMCASLNITGEQTATVLSDCYSPDCDISVSRKLLKIDRIEKMANPQISAKGDISVPEGYPSVSRICNISSKPYIEKVIHEDNLIRLEGILKLSVLYLTGDPEIPVCSFKDTVPFTHSVNIDSCTDFMVDCHIHSESLSYTLPDEHTINIRANMNASVKIICSENVSVIDEINISECEKEPSSSIIIYFVQPEDTLWSVAKKYRTSIEKISTLNSVSRTTPLSPGTRLLIPTT